MTDHAAPPPPPPGYVPIVGVIGPGGRVILSRPLPSPGARPALRLVKG